jgi:hypothetical protein
LGIAAFRQVVIRASTLAGVKGGKEMLRGVEAGQSFQDVTGLNVQVQEVVYDRVRFSVIDDEEAVPAGEGEMSCLAFSRRFTRIGSTEEDCERIKQLGYAASRHIRIYGEEFELLSDPFPQANRIAICAKAKGDSRARVIGLPVTITQSLRARAYVPDCSVCNGPVELTTAKTDGNGRAVHEECYLLRLNRRRNLMYDDGLLS